MPTSGQVPPALLLLLATCGLHAATTSATAPLVQVAFYGEALCPFCVEFTLKSLAPLYANNIIFGDAAIAQLEYIPWGNARYDSASETFTCQHGSRECELDAVFSCVIAQQPQSWFPFVHCVEAHVFKDKDVQHLVERCASEANLNVDSILDCSSGAEGRRLQLEAYQRTADLRPQHQGVPWVTVNGIPLDDDTPNVLKYICAAYSGTRPEICFAPNPDDDDERVQGTAAAEAGFKMLFRSFRQLVKPLLVGGRSLEARRLKA